jgi:hypothetical protein
MFRAATLVGLASLCCAAGAQVSAPAPTSPVPAELFSGETVKKVWEAAPRHLTIQLPGMSHHFSSPTSKSGRVLKNREYNERNWGIGVQLEKPLTGSWDQWVTKTSFGLMKDSLNAMGAYAGYTVQKRLADGETFSADLGGGGFLFYRTLRFDGPHLLVPAVLPVLSVLHKPTQVGVNVVAVPEFKTDKGKMPGVVYLQFTKSF